jgi:hypothetical protein
MTVDTYFVGYVLIFTCSGDTDGSVGVSDEVREQLSEQSSSISGSKVLLGRRPLMMAPLIGGVISNSSIISSVSSPLSDDIEPS